MKFFTDPTFDLHFSLNRTAFLWGRPTSSFQASKLPTLTSGVIRKNCTSTTPHAFVMGVKGLASLHYIILEHKIPPTAVSNTFVKAMQKN